MGKLFLSRFLSAGQHLPNRSGAPLSESFFQTANVPIDENRPFQRKQQPNSEWSQLPPSKVGVSGARRSMKMSKYLTMLLLLLTTFTVAQEILPLHQVKPGMTGYGISVFKGHQRQRFQVEVIDIFKGFLPAKISSWFAVVRCSAASISNAPA